MREAQFIMHTKELTPRDQWESYGYIGDIVAVCTLNQCIEVFTVRQHTPLFRDKFFEVHIKLPSMRTGRTFGTSTCKTLDEAIDVGRQFINGHFPLIEKE